MRRSWLFLLCSISLWGEYTPWFTGPLLAPFCRTVAPKHTNWQPYLFFTDDIGTSDHKWKHSSAPNELVVNGNLLVTRGFTDFFDTQLVLNVFYKKENGQSSTRLGDTAIIPSFQALVDNPHGIMPDLRITFSQSFPTGKYQKLNPRKNGTDSSGSGAFTTAPGLNFQKLFHIYDHHYLRMRLTTAYALAIPVHVKGFNTYGGGFGTRGTVHPGNKWTAILAGEYTFTQNWVAAIDIMQIFENKTRFSGKRGRTAEGLPARVGGPSKKQLSLAPAIEYNFSKNLGVIGGVWFSVWSHNEKNFISGVISVNYLQGP